jgi:hypothetical protein
MSSLRPSGCRPVTTHIVNADSDDVLNHDRRARIDLRVDPAAGPWKATV